MLQMTSDNDVDKLFENYTVKEVKQKLSFIRNDIEKKKEDLRVMVGERYRDLIEAADTIQEMESSSAGVCSEISNVQQLCSSLQHRGLIGFRTSSSEQRSREEGRSTNREVGSAAKVIVVASSCVWPLIEQRRLLAATQVFLLARHTHTALSLTAPHKMNVAAQLPVVARHWSSVRLLPQCISGVCERTITHHHKPAARSQVCESVVSLMLLQDLSLTAALSRVLQLLRGMLLDALSSNSGGQTARPLITRFAARFVSAVTLLCDIFAPGESDVSAVERCLEELRTAPAAITLLQEDLRCSLTLPHALTQYRVELPPRDCRLSPDGLTNQVTAWRDELEREAKHRIQGLLSYSMSLHSLSLIRDSVWRTLDSCPPPLWQQVTAGCGLTGWCVWDSCVRDCVQERSRLLVAQQLDAAVTNTLSDARDLASSIRTSNKVCYEEGSGVVRFVWSEGPSDLPDKVGWLSAAQRTLHQSPGLAFKSYGYTGRTQTICASLDSQLAALREDLSHLQHQEGQRPGSAEDYTELLQLLQTRAQQSFAGLVTGIEGLAVTHGTDELGSAVDNTNEDSSGGGLRWQEAVVVSLARLSHALTNVCPNMQLCSMATALLSQDTVRRVSLGLSVEGEWSAVHKQLDDACCRLLTLLLSSLCDALKSTVTQHLLRPIQQLTPLMLLPALGGVEVVEVQHGDVTSSLSVPCQPSPALSRALLALCRSLNAATLHSLNSVFSSRVAGVVCGAVVSVYSDVVAACLEARNQQLALHLLFDLKFVAVTMLSSDMEKQSCGQELLGQQQQLQSCVDPFDLSVYSSHLTERVRAAANRSQVLLGAVYIRDRHHPAVKSSSFSSSAPLALVPVVDIPRFSNVPLPKVPSTLELSSSALTGSTLSMVLQAKHEVSDHSHLTAVSSASHSHLAAASSAGQPAAKSAASIFSAMSSSWFGGSSK